MEIERYTLATGESAVTGFLRLCEIGVRFAGSQENLARWRVWWRRANIEHLLSFYLLCVLSLALFCLITYSLLAPGAPVAEEFGFIRAQGYALEERFGPAARHLFWSAGIAVLFSTELALLDAVTRCGRGYRSGLAARLGRKSVPALHPHPLGSDRVRDCGSRTRPQASFAAARPLRIPQRVCHVSLLRPPALAQLALLPRPSATRLVPLSRTRWAILFFGYFSLLTLSGQLARLLL
jgi:hypothetical protein